MCVTRDARFRALRAAAIAAATAVDPFLSVPSFIMTTLA
jgi:hypothetical protein